jgi:hypothetical protein
MGDVPVPVPTTAGVAEGNSLPVALSPDLLEGLAQAPKPNTTTSSNNPILAIPSTRPVTFHRYLLENTIKMATASSWRPIRHMTLGLGR